MKTANCTDHANFFLTIRKYSQNVQPLLMRCPPPALKYVDITGNIAGYGGGSNTRYTDKGGDLENDKDFKNNPRLIGANIDMGSYEMQDASGISGHEISANVNAVGMKGKISVQVLQNTFVSIFTNEGELIYNDIIDSGEKEIPFTEGVYIVSFDGLTKKVVVQ